MNFNQLYVKYHGLLYYWILGITHNPPLAEDIVSAAFVKAWKNRRTLQNPSKFKAWLYQIAYNELKMYWRGLDTPMPLDGIVETMKEPRHFIEELEARQSYDRAMKLIRGLRAPWREAIERRLQDKPCQGTWGSRLNAARKKLQGVL